MDSSKNNNGKSFFFPPAPPTKNEKDEVKQSLTKRLKSIIRKEKKDISKKELDLIVNSKFPDMRRCLNELEVF